MSDVDMKDPARERGRAAICAAPSAQAGTKIRLFSETEWHRATEFLTLTPRQSEIARLTCEGHTYGAIAAHTGISINTVRMHMRALFAKTGVHSRLSMILQLIAAGRTLSYQPRAMRASP